MSTASIDNEPVVDQVEESLADDSIADSTADSNDTSTVVEDVITAPPSLDDESAFPTLGSGKFNAKSSPVSWGPSMKTAVSTPLQPASSNASFNSSAIPSSTSQEVFIISHVVALKTSRDEYVKILNDVKNKHNVAIDATLSSITQDRSVVVRGRQTDVASARKELVRRLTKPVVIDFTVPASTRSIIIGAGGKNLKPIIETTRAKIDIQKASSPLSDANSDEEELIQVTVEGDVDGVEEAKQLILAIVKDETKNLTSKVIVPEKLLPFVNDFEISTDELTVTGPNKNGLVIISGLRDQVLQKKSEINKEILSLDGKIVTFVKAVSKSSQQFINAADLLKKHNVVVEIPSGAEQNVKFIGLQKNIDEALKTAEATVKQFLVLDVTISMAHGKNVNHARYLTAFLASSGILEKIGSENNTKLTAPSYKELAANDLTAVVVKISGTKDESAAITASKAELVAEVNKFSPSRLVVISDISSFFANSVASVTETAAKESNVYVVPFSQLSSGATNDIVLVALDGSVDEFAPTQEEIDARLQTTAVSLEQLRKAQADLKAITLDVPSDKQQFIAGPNGTTLKSLIKSIGDITVKLHFDGEAESADKVYIHGTKTDVAKMEREITDLLKDAADQKDLFSFVSESSVPTTVLSRLIGKSGAMLKEICDKFVVNIDVDKDTSAEKTSLKITGYKFNVKEAEHHIAAAAKKWADETTKTLVVAKKYRASLIGSNGQHVKKLQNKYHVAIHFQRDSDEVTVKGPSRGVASASQELADLLSFEIDNGYVKELQVPDAAIARVIGRSGENVHRIAIDCGIDIRVSPAEDKPEDDKTEQSKTRIVKLTGPRSGLTKAEKEIMAIVKEFENTVTEKLEIDPKYFRDILGPKGAMKDQILAKALGHSEGGPRKLLEIPEAKSDSKIVSSTGPKAVVDSIIAQVKAIVADKESCVTEKIDVPKDKHRLLIGPGGSTRRSLEEEFHITLDVPKVGTKTEEVSIVGQPANVEKAKVKVISLTAEAWKTVVSVPAYVHAAVHQRGLFTRKLRTEYNVEVNFDDSKKAQKLSNELPKVPEDVRGTEEETFKFTTIADSGNRDNGDIIWRLIGDDEAVALAEKLIQAAVKQHSEDDTIGFLWVKDSSKIFPKIVGSQGARLNSTRRKTGAQIIVPKASDLVSDIIYVKGQKAAVEKAEKILCADVKA